MIRFIISVSFAPAYYVTFLNISHVLIILWYYTTHVYEM
jgi:hypothetical protein